MCLALIISWWYCTSGLAVGPEIRLIPLVKKSKLKKKKISKEYIPLQKIRTKYLETGRTVEKLNNVPDGRFARLKKGL